MSEITSNEMYGIAKKFNAEMEALPMHTHSAIVEMVRVGMQHRNLQLQAADKARNEALQERAVRIQEQQVRIAAAAAVQHGPVLVPQ
jgi:hypothetical protein